MPPSSHAVPPLPPPDYKRRQFALPELLDGPCTFADWRAASLDLARLNRVSRAYQPALGFLHRAVERTGVGYEPLHIVDIGCGHGDALREIYRWGRRRSLPLRLTGVDLNPYAARLARERDRAEYIPAGAISRVTADVFQWRPEQPADYILSSLFTHHLSDADIVRFLGWCDARARAGWLLTDLVRSPRAATVSRWLVRLLRLHPFLLHDAPVSFRRALSRGEWEPLLQEAGIAGAEFRGRRGRLTLECLRDKPRVSGARGTAAA